MAENARPFGGVLPADATPDQDRLNRRVFDSLAGRRGQFFGRDWRAMEAPYPDKSGPLCLHFQVRAASGWRTVFVVKPDGTFTGVAP